MKQYDFVVVGNGLLGSACSYLLSRKGYSVALSSNGYGNNDIYSSHQDTSRLYRQYDTDCYWSALAIRNYQMLHQIPGGRQADFFRPVDVRYYGSGDVIVDPLGGIINPVALISILNAQSKDVTLIDAIKGYCVGRPIKVETFSGITYRCNRLVDVRGGFDPFVFLEPYLQIWGKVLVLCKQIRSEIDAGTYVVIDSKTPSEEFSDFYSFLNVDKDRDLVFSKFGGTERQPVLLPTNEKLVCWFRSDYRYSASTIALLNYAKRTFSPSLELYDVRPCVFTKTVDNRPLVRRTDETMKIIGCNGMAAKCSLALAEQCLEGWGV